MANSAISGKVQTVSGTIAPEALGITLCHEHLLVDLTAWFSEPEEASQKALAYQPVCMENLHWLHYHAANNLDNLTILDEELAVKEAVRFKLAGGDSIVDLSNIGLARDPLALKRIARATGLNIVMGCGYYVEQTRPAEFAQKSEDQIADEIVKDVTVGVGNTGVKSGIIGEIGCRDPLSESDRKLLRSAAIAQQRTGAPMNIHPGYPNFESPMEIVGLLKDAGANLGHTVMSHVCSLDADTDAICKLAESGCYLEYDLFGRAPGVIIGSGQSQAMDFMEVLSDGKQIDIIRKLIKLGYLEKIIISHDVCHKIRLHHYGGSGFDHILVFVVPLMRAMGMTDEQIDTILIENPRRLMAFD